MSAPTIVIERPQPHLRRFIVPHARGAYPVVVGVGAAGGLFELLEGLTPKPSSVVVVSDRNVHDYVLDVLNKLTAANPALRPLGCVEITATERNKSLTGLRRLFDAVLKLESPPDRDTVVLAIGGGVTGDLVGFFAATYLRGVRVVHLPTTVVSMVDSSIGGKTGINHQRGKNLIGAFHQPSAVVADLTALLPLAPRQRNSGYAEVVKVGLALEPQLCVLLEQLFEIGQTGSPAIADHFFDQQAELVAQTARAKACVVSQDERESGVREVLNFGHTVGHALEASADGRLLHGEAVGIGMLAEASVARQHGITPEATLVRLTTMLCMVGLRTAAPDGIERSRLIAAMLADKKRRNGKLRIAVPRELGTWQVVETTAEALADAVQSVTTT